MNTQPITTDINAAIALFDTPEQRLVEAENLYLGLTINGTSDKEGYAAATEGIRTVRTTRTTLEKKRKEIVAPANDFVDQVNDFAKKTTARLKSIEEHLKAETDKIDKAKEHERLELIRVRTQQLKEAGYIFDGNYYSIGTALIHPTKIDEFDDEQWLGTLDFGKREAKRIADIKAKEEAERKAKEAAEQAERERLRQEKEASDRALVEAMAKIKELEEAQAKANEAQAKQTADTLAKEKETAKQAVDKVFTHPDPVVKPKPKINEPVVKPIVTSAPATNETKHPMELLTSVAADPNTAVQTDQREKHPNFTHYKAGFNKCKLSVIDKLNDPEKFTRAQLIDFVTNLKP